MTQFTVTFQPDQRSVSVPVGSSLLQAQIMAGLRPDAPCGGKGTCGKCRVILEGETVLACQHLVDRNMTVFTQKESDVQILSAGLAVTTRSDGEHDYTLAFDIGTTTVVAYLLDGQSGRVLAQDSMVNPQSQFGADVISRIQYALQEGSDALSGCIREALNRLTEKVAAKAGITPAQITGSTIVGNTAMHHLLLGVTRGLG